MELLVLCRSDCGMFVVKFAEFLLANMDVGKIQSMHMKLWRVKLVAELLASKFEP